MAEPQHHNTTAQSVDTHTHNTAKKEKNTGSIDKNNMERKLYLQTLCNQLGDFKIAYSYKNEQGIHIWTKHRTVMECWEKTEHEWMLNKANHRSILTTEIILDLDTKPTLKKATDIYQKIKELNFKKIALYQTGSKGYHIHIQDPLLDLLTYYERKQLREMIILYSKCDAQKKHETTMIALENHPHWKTNKQKKMVIGNWFP